MNKYLIAGAAALALTAALSIQSWRLERVKTELHDSKQANAVLQRAVEIGRADAKDQASQCTARVAEARASAIRIERIYDRPIHVDPTGCAVRDLIGADELREALQPGLEPSP